MDKPCMTHAAPTGAGELTTFYAYDNSTARSVMLTQLAGVLAGAPAGPDGPGGAPVLMIDWDLEAPGLHQLSGSAGERPGLLEFIEACRDRLAAMTLARAGAANDPDELARAVLAAVDWRAYIEQVDAVRPLYLMRAGRVDATYGERAAQLDWSALFHACPALLRQWRAQMAQVFRHVFIDARSGRSAAVSVCTSLLPDKLVGLFGPTRRSLDGLCGVVERAIAYRCSHEEEQRPLLLYPVPCAPPGASAARCLAWRRGMGGPPGLAGYQARVEALMRASYGHQQLSLENYFDMVQVQPCDAICGEAELAAQPAAAPAPVGPSVLALLDWFADGFFPWQSHPGRLRTSAASMAAQPVAGLATHAATPLSTPGAHAQFPALRPLAVPASRLARSASGGTGAAALHVAPTSGADRRHPGFHVSHSASGAAPRARAGEGSHDQGDHGSHDGSRDRTHDRIHDRTRDRILDGTLDATRMGRLVDAVETELDHLQQLVDQHALREARPVADKLRHLVLRPAVALALRRRGAALIKLVYRHDNDTDALLAFTQDELASLEQVLSEAAAGHPLAFS